MIYYQPDITWQSFQITSQDEFEAKYIVKGKFHENVHEDVLKAYLTVEYLIAHSYYHYPMYDEAVKKAFNIFEMSIKLRCKAANIPISYSDKNGVWKNYPLGQLVDKIIKLGYPDELNNNIDWLRELRNMFAHPSQHSFGMGMLRSPFSTIINILNQIFLPLSYFQEKEKKVLALKSIEKQLKDKLYVYEYQDIAILIHHIKFTDTFRIGEDWWQFWELFPVMKNNGESSYRNALGAPLLLVLKDVQFTNDIFKGTSFESQESISINETLKDANLNAFANYKKHLNLYKPEEKLGGHLNNTFEERQQFIYMNCWPEMNIIEEN